jgi:hypothetical protein
MARDLESAALFLTSQQRSNQKPMRQYCRICCHPEREAIESSLRAGSSLRELAARFGATKDGLWRHRQNHLSDSPDGATPSGAEPRRGMFPTFPTEQSPDPKMLPANDGDSEQSAADTFVAPDQSAEVMTAIHESAVSRDTHSAAADLTPPGRSQNAPRHPELDDLRAIGPVPRSNPIEESRRRRGEELAVAIDRYEARQNQLSGFVALKLQTPQDGRADNVSVEKTGEVDQ